MPAIPTIRIVVSGDEGTGKSCLVNFYVRSFFSDEFDPTIEETYFKQITFNEQVYNLEVVDTVENEFRSEEEKNTLYATADAIILTYAVDDVGSFNNLILRYSNLPINEEDDSTKLIYRHGRIKRFPPIILAGTKYDLALSRQVAVQAAEKLVHDLNLQGFIECSSASNINVDELFSRAIELGLEHQKSDHDLTHIYAADEESQNRNSENKSASCSFVSKNSVGNLRKYPTNPNSKQVKGAKNFTAIEEQTSRLSAENIHRACSAAKNKELNPATKLNSRKTLNTNTSQVKGSSSNKIPNPPNQTRRNPNSVDKGCCTIV